MLYDIRVFSPRALKEHCFGDDGAFVIYRPGRVREIREESNEVRVGREEGCLELCV
jgi:hypothetical protein